MFTSKHDRSVEITAETIAKFPDKKPLPAHRCV
jgi:hypothetical protein